MLKIFLLGFILSTSSLIAAAGTVLAPPFVSAFLPSSDQIGAMAIHCQASGTKTQLLCQMSKLSVSSKDAKVAATSAIAEVTDLKKFKRIDEYVKSICENPVITGTKTAANPQEKSGTEFKKRRAPLCACKTADCRQQKLTLFLSAEASACRLQINQFQVALEGVDAETWEYHVKDLGPCAVKVDSVLKLQGGVPVSFHESTGRKGEGAGCASFPQAQELDYNQKNLGRYMGSCQELTVQN